MKVNYWTAISEQFDISAENDNKKSKNTKRANGRFLRKEKTAQNSAIWFWLNLRNGVNDVVLSRSPRLFFSFRQ